MHKKSLVFYLLFFFKMFGSWPVFGEAVHRYCCENADHLNDEEDSFRGLPVLGESINQFNESYICISLGKNCQCAQQLNSVGLRKSAYPFDWILTEDCDALIKILRNDFKDFLPKDNLHKIAEYPRSLEAWYLNSLYNTKFLHDFKCNQSFEAMYPKIKEKYDRRIDRFRAACESGKFIYFFRRDISPENAQQLRDVICEKYPNLKFLIVAVEIADIFKADWKIPNVKPFCLESYPTGFLTENAWPSLFQKLDIANSHEIPAKT